MNVGLMWYDDDPKKPIESKIEQAAARYREKYGQAPNACYVNSNAGAAPTGKAAGAQGGLRVIPAAAIRPNYFWVGVDSTEAGEQPVTAG